MGKVTLTYHFYIVLHFHTTLFIHLMRSGSKLHCLSKSHHRYLTFEQQSVPKEVDYLSNLVIPSVDFIFSDSPDIFKDDKANIHGAHIVKVVQEVETFPLDWPQSPELDHIEDLCTVVTLPLQDLGEK